VRQLVIKVLNIIDARCNHEDAQCNHEDARCNHEVCCQKCL